MIPRGQIDIGWTDLVRATLLAVDPRSASRAAARLEHFWDPDGRAVATLSVRSGLDLVLRVLDLPPGSRVLVSAITIRDMVTILEEHDLEPVPVDLDMDRLEVDGDALRGLVTPGTRALLVAHLFGSRMPMEPLVEFAREHDLLLLEDCAQAYDGNGYRGHPEADVSMFSFGPIKTNTALGGGLLRFRDPRAARRVRALQSTLPVQTRPAYLARVAKYAAIRGLLARAAFTLFAAACRALGRSHDRVLADAVRGFGRSSLLPAIRRRPSYPLLALLHRRLTGFRPARITARVRLANRILGVDPGISRPGRRARRHSHWVVPILVPDPDRVCRALWSAGIDATRGASSLFALPPRGTDGPHLPVRAHAAMRRTVYLPFHPGIGRRDLDRLRAALAKAAREPSASGANPDGGKRAASDPSLPGTQPRPAGIP